MPDVHAEVERGRVGRRGGAVPRPRLPRPRDGVLEGPDFNFYQEILTEFPNLKVLASGGIRGVDDIRRLNEMGIFAVIFGKAFYEGILKLKDLEQFLIKS